MLDKISHSTAVRALLFAFAAAACSTENVDPIATTSTSWSTGSGGTTSMTTGPGGFGGAGTAGSGGMTVGTGGNGGQGGSQPSAPVADFLLLDVNPSSVTFDQPVSPRDYLMRVSAWYFGHST